MMRKACFFATLAVFLLSAAAAFAADKYPTKPVTLVVPQAAGGATDLAARAYASVAQKYFGVPVVIRIRAGAGTVWESAACGKPMLLIPLSGSGTRGDQVENAGFFEKAGAAMVFDGSDDRAVLSALVELAGDEGKRAQMAAASKALGQKDAAQTIADVLSGEATKYNGVYNGRN
jgi:hypothetical protein